YGIVSDDPQPVQSLFEGWGQIDMTFGATDIFSSTDHDVLYVKVQSPDLIEMHEAVVNQLDVADTKVYRPHATIAYLKPGLGNKYVSRDSLVGLTAEVDKVFFCPKDGEEVTIELGGNL